jgi:phage gp29-like protein
MGEIASAVDDIYGTYWGARKYNPDKLAAKKGGLLIYKEMRDDDQVKASLHLKKTAILHPGWDIEGENEQQVEYLKEILNNIEGSIEELARSIMSAYDYGFSVHEKVYHIIENGPFKGKVGLKSVRQKSPTRIDFEVDDFGRLKKDGILQRQTTGQIRRLEIGKFVLHSYQKEFDNYYGESDLKAAYRFWFLKINFFRYWGMYLERYGIPLAIGKTENKNIDSTEQARFRTLVSNIQAGMAAVLPPELEIDFKEAAVSRGDTFARAVDACDVRIARAILQPQLVGLAPQGQQGSYSRAKEEADTLDMVLGGDSKKLQETINEQIIRELVDFNFGKQDKYPIFAFKPMREEDKLGFIKTWNEAIAKGAATKTPETEEHVRSVLNFPEPTPEEKTAIKEAAKPKDPLEDGLIPDGGIKKKPADKGNGLDKKVYVLTSMNAQEARKAWKEHVEQLDDLEEDAKIYLSEAFESSIKSLTVDAKKKS